MKPLLTDPVVLICSGIILVGIFGLFWAIGKFRRLQSAPKFDTNEETIAAAPELSEIDFRAPALTVSPPPNSSSPAVSKEVANRLESMTQRLTEMQTLLMKQSAGAVVAGGGGPTAGGVGQGFSPETIDKLLKIIGNVIQQVDILQKSMTVPKA